MVPLTIAQPSKIEPDGVAPSADGAMEVLRETFETNFTLWDVNSEALRQTDEELFATHHESTESVSNVVQLAAKSDKPICKAIDDSRLVLAIPIAVTFRDRHVATAVFYQKGPPDGGYEVDSGAPAWTVDILMRLANCVVGRIRSESRVRKLESEVEKVSDNLATTYEEICLLHSVTQNLQIFRTDDRLARIATERLLNCVPLECVAVQFLPVAHENEITYDARTETQITIQGDCPISRDEFGKLLEYLDLDLDLGPFVINPNVTSKPDWPYPSIHELIVVPLSDGKNLFGWIAGFNHLDGKELGTVEANLFASLGAILGTHSGNRELYRQQREFVAEMVRALTSAIDAKDPYTCGHSDRVARVSVRIAQQMGCDQEFIDTIYMAGLLHDAGKIGVDDYVLRKPGKLTDEEFEQIKLHPEIGYNILRDLRHIRDCLPAVLHHHEQWDGGGYPHGLEGEDIPLIARVMAVADAYDAMHSDRPYRKGMPEEKVEQILRDGAGQQWDAKVVEAYFAARNDIREISTRERADLTLNVREWMAKRLDRP